MKALNLSAVAITALLASGQCLADYRQGDLIVRIGAGEVNPDDESNWLRLDGTALEDTRVAVDSGNAATFTGTWLFADHWGLGLLAATPFEHDLDVLGLPNPAGGVLGKVPLGDIEHLPPTFTVQWFPVCQESWVQPYVGIGVNYTTFFDEDLSSTAQGYFQDVLGATSNASLDLDDSWGLAGEVGVDIGFGAESRWLFNAAIWYLDIDTDAKIRFRNANGGRSTIATEVDIDPFVYSIGIGYRF